MRVAGSFTVRDFAPSAVARSSEIATGLPVGVATMEKTYAGEIAGRSVTLFTAAFDPARGMGHYLALESFAGRVAGKEGAFNFVHAASTAGKDRRDAYFVIVAGSGTGDLSAIAGTGDIAVDADGTHRVWFDLSDI